MSTFNAQKATPENTVPALHIKVLGGGCKKCHRLEENLKSALLRLGLQADLEHVSDFAQIAAYGVLATPALVINEEVVVSGRLLKEKDLIPLLQARVRDP